MPGSESTEGSLIDARTVHRVAALARLRVSEEDARLYADQIGRILQHVRSIQALDLDGVEPMTHPGDQALELHDDVASEPLPHETLMEMAPQSAPPFIKVPKVLPGQDGGGEGGA